LYAVQDIQGFNTPIVDLEQYPTGAEIASRMLFTVRRVKSRPSYGTL
jgi:predicted RNA methylase